MFLTNSATEKGILCKFGCSQIFCFKVQCAMGHVIDCEHRTNDGFQKAERV